MEFASAFKFKQWANMQLLTYGERQIHQLPAEDARYFIRILHHTSVVDSLFISRISGVTERYTADNTPETPIMSQLQQTMATYDQWLVDYTEQLSQTELERTISFQFTDGDFGCLTIAEILIHLLTHGSNHRGMASRVLSSHGLQRPKDTFTRYLHQIEPLRSKPQGELDS